LSDLFILRGAPGHVRSDNGPEFAAKAVRKWIVAVGYPIRLRHPEETVKRCFTGNDAFNTLHSNRRQFTGQCAMTDEGNLRLKRPAHPGGFVKHEVLQPLGLSVTEAAGALGVTRPALSALLNERAHLSPEMAIRIEKAFGVSMETLMRMQNSYDIAQARRREAEIKVERYTGMNTKGRA